MSRFLLALLLLALGGALVAGCNGGGDDDADLSGVDGAQLLEDAAARLETVESFHFRVEHENGSTQIISGLAMTEAEGDFAGADRVRVELRARAFGTNIASGVVILPDVQYFLNPINGRWMEQEIALAQLFDPASGVTALMRGASNPRVVRAEDIDGAEVYVVEADVESGALAELVANAQPGQTVVGRVWIGVDEPLVYRAEVVGQVAPGDTEETVRRIDLSAHDEPVEITAPE